jgi:hypothetical protein
VQTYLDQLRGRARVRVAIDGDAADLADALMSAISQAGAQSAQPGDTTAEAALELRGRCDVQPAGTAMSGARVARARAVVEVVRLDTGAVVGTVERSATGGGRTMEDALHRATREAAALVTPDAKKMVAQLVNGADEAR